MPTDEEILLRARLGRALDDVTAGPPPVATVLRKARTMRVTHRAATGIAVVACLGGLTAGIAGLTARQHAQPPAATPVHHKPLPPTHVEVARLPSHASDGVIAQGGATSGNSSDHWRFWLNFKTGHVDDGVTGFNTFGHGTIKYAERQGGIATLHYGQMEAWFGFYAVVRNDVTRIEVRLSNHQVVNLYPVSADDHRWIGFAAPIDLAATRLIAYAGTRELGHSVVGPYDMSNWLRPGQSGPARTTVQIGHGLVPKNSRVTWTASVHAGPWGYCFWLRGHRAALEEDCISQASARTPGVHVVLATVPKFLAHWYLGTALPSVAYLKVVNADGTSIQAPIVRVDGQGFFAFAVVRGQVPTSWAAYDATGHKLYGGPGTPPYLRDGSELLR